MANGCGRSRYLWQLAPAFAGIAMACGAGIAPAQEAAFPSRTVQFVVAYSPGTGADILARLFGPRLAERWKASVVTENRVGATGAIASAHVAKSAPDGHTLLFIATSFGMVPAIRSHLDFDPINSFAPVMLFATSGLGLVVHPQLPVKSLREFIDLAKRRPGELHYSSPGVGGPQHLSMELLKLEAGIDIVHVPYKGFAGAISDAVAGHVQAMVSALQSAYPYVKSGRLRMLAIMNAERSSAFPGVPTMKELGFPGMEIYTWYGAFAPAGTPASVVKRINADMNDLLRLPEIRAPMTRLGMVAAGGPPERLGGLVKSELERWNRVVKAAKIKAD